MCEGRADSRRRRSSSSSREQRAASSEQQAQKSCAKMGVEGNASRVEEEL